MCIKRLGCLNKTNSVPAAYHGKTDWIYQSFRVFTMFIPVSLNTLQLKAKISFKC